MVLKNIKKNKYLSRNQKFIRKISGFKSDILYECAIVIPAYDELEYLDKTLKSLFENDLDLIKTTLILIVVNNPDSIDHNSEIFYNNQKLLSQLEEINKSNINLCWIDSSSKGAGLKGKGGVGLARKIGMDSVLQYLNWEGDPLIFSLDADTIVSQNYLISITDYFAQNKEIVCVTVPFKHLRDGTAEENTTIDDYEYYLNNYVDMLKYAGSPYAYHAIGSAMIFRGSAYIKTGGMKVNCAGEDFYFLQDIRKIGLIGEVKSTKVFQSSRPSDRVPFGTGPTIIKNSENNNIKLYNPKIFYILKDFLQIVNKWILENEPEDIQYLKERVCNETAAFLNEYGFENVWPKIIKNNIRINSMISENECRNKLLWCFNIWFDAFKTLKFVHYMEKNYPEKYSKITIEENKQKK
jgi:glycosyltransferase involved in cell wall biosynthesis